MRGSSHSLALRAYEITPTGAVMNEFLRDYHGIITGVPSFTARLHQAGYTGLTDREASALDTLIRLRAASADALSAQTGVPPDEMARILNRFIALDFAIIVEVDGKQVYRALARVADR